MDNTTSTIEDLCTARGDLLDTQAYRTRLLDRDGYYLEADPKVTERIDDLTEQIELLETLQWLEPTVTEQTNAAYMAGSVDNAPAWLDDFVEAHEGEIPDAILANKFGGGL